MIKIIFAERDIDLVFVEVEDMQGNSIRIGTWVKEGDHPVLIIDEKDIRRIMEEY